MNARQPRRALTLAAVLAVAAPGAASARTEVFNGRIAFTSFRSEPPAGQMRSGDIFSMNADVTDLRQLTTNPQADRQPDWSPTGSDIAYTIRKPGSAANFEVARMSAAGKGHRQLTTTETGQASSQPSWFPNSRGFLYRRSGPERAASIWQMDPLGMSPALRFAAPHPPLYPAFSPDMTKILFTAVTAQGVKPDRGIFTVNADGSALTTVMDVPGAFDSAPVWSPDGTRIAFETDADIGGANPEGDLEIWTMAADGSDATQLTRNALHDEGPAWSPDGGRMLAYTSGIDNTHGDINIMTTAGEHIRQLTFYEGIDESPDWQAIPAPTTSRRCGDVAARGRGAHDVRAAGRGLPCGRALDLARRWTKTGRPRRISRFGVQTGDFGGTQRIVMRRDEPGHRQLVAFLYQPPAAASQGS